MYSTVPPKVSSLGIDSCETFKVVDPTRCYNKVGKYAITSKIANCGFGVALTKCVEDYHNAICM